MTLCAVSRFLNYWITGRRTCICTDAYIRGPEPWRRTLDVLMRWRDRNDHCLRTAAKDAVHGVYNGTGFGLSGERGHCRAAWARERAEMADLPGRLRRAGM